MSLKYDNRPNPAPDFSGQTNLRKGTNGYDQKAWQQRHNLFLMAQRYGWKKVIKLQANPETALVKDYQGRHPMEVVHNYYKESAGQALKQKIREAGYVPPTGERPEPERK